MISVGNLDRRNAGVAKCMQFAAWSCGDKSRHAVIPNGGHGRCKRIGSAIARGDRLLSADELARLAGG